MSNEELAARIQAGERELLPQLWEQVRRFVVKMAYKRYVVTNGLGGVELDDLIQSGFLAVVEAVEYFEPDGEYMFLSYLGNRLKSAFADAGGYRTSKRDPLIDCASLDTPLGDDSDSDTLLDLQPDPTDQIGNAERRIWLEQLRETMSKAICNLPQEQQAALACRYWKGLTLEETGAALGVNRTQANQYERKALYTLAKNKYRNGLSQFVEERTLYYTHVGIAAFTATKTSAVEKIVLQREKYSNEYAGNEYAGAGTPARTHSD